MYRKKDSTLGTEKYRKMSASALGDHKKRYRGVIATRTQTIDPNQHHKQTNNISK